MVIFEDCGFDMHIGYIQNNANKSEQIQQHQTLLAYAKDNHLNLECVYVDTSFDNLKDVILPACAGILVYNISSLGESLIDIKDNLLFCRAHGLMLKSVEDDYCFDANSLTDDFFKGIDVAIDIRSRLISQNTKRVLQQRKTQGVKLGRPLGAFVRKKLEGKEEEIRQLLACDISKSEIARRYGVSRITVFNFVKRNGLEYKRRSVV